MKKLVVAISIMAIAGVAYACCGPYCEDPSLTVSCDPCTLWSPNHKYVGITVTAVSNIEAGGTVKIVSVASSEPDDADGGGDGKTTDDIVITGDLTVDARAERQGGGPGRTYTICVEARQPAPCEANFTIACCTVFVPHDQGD